MNGLGSWQAAWSAMAQEAWQIAEDHGFHDGYSFGTKIALLHSELSEALEAHRRGNGPSEHIPEFSGIEEELADVVIRVMDEAQEQGHDVAAAVIAKMAYNDQREHKHGKVY